MSKPRPIWYEPHPVSPERKAELRALGYQVSDLKQAPEGWKPPAPAADAETLDVPEFLKTEKPATPRKVK